MMKKECLKPLEKATEYAGYVQRVPRNESF